MSAPKRVLVVDADESNRAVVDVALPTEGYEVTVPVSDGTPRAGTQSSTQRRWWPL